MAKNMRGENGAGVRVDPAAVSGNKKTAAGWNIWQTLPAGHNKAVTAIRALETHTDAFLAQLAAARGEYEDALKRSAEAYRTAASAAQAQFRADCKRWLDEYNKNVKATKAKMKNGAELEKVCRSFLGEVSKRGARYAANSNLGAVERSRENLERAIAQQVGAYKTLYDARVAEAERRRNAALERAAYEQRLCDTSALKTFEEKKTCIGEACGRDIDAGFNRGYLLDYRQKINAARIPAEDYVSPGAVPDIVPLGSICLSFSGNLKDGKVIVDAVKRQTADTDLSREYKNEYIVELPYAQRLQDGLSLLIRHSPKDKSAAQKLIQPLLMKLFMSIPAGKLEATMIDPLQFGENFEDIRRLVSGPGTERIIDKKIWRREEDIEKALSELLQRLENVSHAYGTDRASRLKKEVLRVLAINDFPAGFTDTALKHLTAIVRNSASLGVCVLINANEEEFVKLRERNAGLAQEISQNMVETLANGKRLTLDPENGRIFLRLDEMPDAMRHKDAILAEIREKIDVTPMKIEYFANMFPGKDITDSGSWFGAPRDMISIPIGIKGAKDVVRLELGRDGGSIQHHALIAGQTGAGKSTLLHTLILSALISYPADELQLYLLDFKEGVEFIPYTRYRLPSIRIIAIHSEPEYGLAVMRELCKELDVRAQAFIRSGVTDINGYNAAPGGHKKMPRLLMVFDEVQDLFRTGDAGDITGECLKCLNKLVMQGRAMGIHVILACQDFRNCAGLESYFNQMAVRIAVKGSEEGVSSVLSANNRGAAALRNEPAGAAIYNGNCGEEPANSIFQVSLVRDAERKELLRRLDAYYAGAYEDSRTRVLLTNAENDIRNGFNRMILQGKDGVGRIGASGDGFGLMLGQGFGEKSGFVTELKPAACDNILICGDERKALSLFEFSAMSILNESLAAGTCGSGPTVYLADIYGDALEKEECSLEKLASLFPQQILRVEKKDAASLVNTLYGILLARAEGSASSGERIFLLFFGLDRVKRLKTACSYTGNGESGLPPADMLCRLFEQGPVYGINSIVWTSDWKDLAEMLDPHVDNFFNKRIVCSMEDGLAGLVDEKKPQNVSENTAVYYDAENDIKNTHFRPYVIPAEVWETHYARAWKKAAGEGGG